MLFTGPIKRFDTEHQDDALQPHKRLQCNGAISPDWDQRPPVLPGTFCQSLLLPSSRVGTFLANGVYQEKESHSQESLPYIL